MKEFFNPKGIFNTRNLVLMALMIGLSTVLNMLTDIYITPTQKLFSFAYLPRAVVAIMYGPIAASATAFVADFTGWVINPRGPYHPGFAISAIVADISCAAFLYKQKISFLRVALWRIFVVVFVFLGLNYMWMNMLYGSSAAGFFTGVRLARNAVQLPLDIFLVMVVGKYIRQYMKQLGWA